MALGVPILKHFRVFLILLFIILLIYKFIIFSSILINFHFFYFVKFLSYS